MRFSHPLSIEPNSQDGNRKDTKIGASKDGPVPQEIAFPTVFESDGNSTYYEEVDFQDYYGSLDTLVDLNAIDASLSFEDFNSMYGGLTESLEHGV